MKQLLGMAREKKDKEVPKQIPSNKIGANKMPQQFYQPPSQSEDN